MSRCHPGCHPGNPSCHPSCSNHPSNSNNSNSPNRPPNFHQNNPHHPEVLHQNMTAGNQAANEAGANNHDQSAINAAGNAAFQASAAGATPGQASAAGNMAAAQTRAESFSTERWVGSEADLSEAERQIREELIPEIQDNIRHAEGHLEFMMDAFRSDFEDSIVGSPGQLAIENLNNLNADLEYWNNNLSYITDALAMIETLDKIKENKLVVEGAGIYCTKGSHFRRLELKKRHGVYIRGRAMAHQWDTKPEYNLPESFGICFSDENPAMQFVYTTEQEHDMLPFRAIEEEYSPEKYMLGKPCNPLACTGWLDPVENVQISDEGGFDTQREQLQDQFGENVDANGMRRSDTDIVPGGVQALDIFAVRAATDLTILETMHYMDWNSATRQGDLVALESIAEGQIDQFTHQAQWNRNLLLGVGLRDGTIGLSNDMIDYLLQEIVRRPDWGFQALFVEAKSEGGIFAGRGYDWPTESGFMNDRLQWLYEDYEGIAYWEGALERIQTERVALAGMTLQERADEDGLYQALRAGSTLICSHGGGTIAFYESGQFREAPASPTPSSPSINGPAPAPL